MFFPKPTAFPRGKQPGLFSYSERSGSPGSRAKPAQKTEMDFIGTKKKQQKHSLCPYQSSLKAEGYGMQLGMEEGLNKSTVWV